MNREGARRFSIKTIMESGMAQAPCLLAREGKIAKKGIFLLVLLACLPGCHPAVLVIPSYIQNVGIPTFDNKTSYFGLETLLTQETIRQFQIDGRVPLEDPEKADLVVKIAITRYVEEPLMYDPKTNFVLQYRISIVYDLAAVDEREKKTFVEDKDKVHSVFYYTAQAQAIGAPSETKEQAQQRLAEDMGQAIVRRVLEGY